MEIKLAKAAGMMVCSGGIIGMGETWDGGRRLFQSGVNATITGDMLTTVGNNTKQDIEILKNMGFDLEVQR